ncbi:MAG: hypothetical protein QXH71_03965 [Candidatus Anstonellaceae archaeon]
MDYNLIIEEVRKTIESGYYENFAPLKKEKRSLVDEIEKRFSNGMVPIILEIAMADKTKLYFSTKNKLLSYLHEIEKQKWIAALNIWVEPKIHAGDIRWLSQNFSTIVVCSDYIIDPIQMVGGDALILDYELVEVAKVDINRLIDFAHEADFETIVKIRNIKEFEEAKKTETDIFMIENKYSIDKTLEILNKINTPRPIIVKNGIYGKKDIRILISSGIKGIEINYEENFQIDSITKKIEEIKNSIKGV